MYICKTGLFKNSIAGMAGNNICSENFMNTNAWGDYEYTNGGHEKFRVHTCLFKDCIYDYNGHEFASGDSTIVNILYIGIEFRPQKFTRIAIGGHIMGTNCFIGAKRMKAMNNWSGDSDIRTCFYVC